ncbi:hypothetical protein Glove_229g131 [Diversispora epigaea]|uniref:CCHC-type domain-containing protein n=1 Tax=Diversispora epigaea TaxID=1348612 RepID=A0A397IG06_9GLOM|nr:hypothetical protein Glove_229g131 [Diversispora epigaea]
MDIPNIYFIVTQKTPALAIWRFSKPNNNNNKFYNRTHYQKNKYSNNKNNNYNNDNNKSNNKGKEIKENCFKCGKPRHYAKECYTSIPITIELVDRRKQTADQVVTVSTLQLDDYKTTKARTRKALGSYHNTLECSEEVQPWKGKNSRRRVGLEGKEVEVIKGFVGNVLDEKARTRKTSNSYYNTLEHSEEVRP